MSAELATTASPSLHRGRAVIYLRVSTAEQAERDGDPEGYSIPAQREACRRKAAGMEAAVVAEYVDRGESARSANRPELQAMLAFIKEQPVDYVIVHKVDRLARSRADDVAINLAIQQAGANLVSVTENIDQTPSGTLLHAIMSGIAEFYSRNLAAEVLKGTEQKVKSGGTPMLAPLGYLNVRERVAGMEHRTIAVDPVRGPIITYAFETLASSDVTVKELLGLLTERGLRTRATRRLPEKPLSLSRLHGLLRSRYYLGFVTYRGVEHPGKHQPLVDADTFEAVQLVLDGRSNGGTKQFVHRHYLRGMLFCEPCRIRGLTSRLLYSRSRGHGGEYDYYFCRGRQSGNGCDQPYIRVERLERKIEDHYSTVQLREDFASELRQRLSEDLRRLRQTSDQEERRQRLRVEQIEAEQLRLVRAHGAGAVPLKILKSEQLRLAKELDDAQRCLTALGTAYVTGERIINLALDLIRDCQAAYRMADPETRRQFNLVFFERIFVDDELITTELATPFAELHALRPASPDLFRSSSGTVRRGPGVSYARGRSLEPFVVGSRVESLVEVAGIEPASFGTEPGLLRA